MDKHHNGSTERLLIKTQLCAQLKYSIEVTDSEHSARSKTIPYKASWDSQRLNKWVNPEISL